MLAFGNFSNNAKRYRVNYPCLLSQKNFEYMQEGKYDKFVRFLEIKKVRYDS